MASARKPASFASLSKRSSGFVFMLYAFVTSREEVLIPPATSEAYLNRAVVVFSRNSQDGDRKSTRLNSSHSQISYAVFGLKKKRDTHFRTNLINLLDDMEIV